MPVALTTLPRRACSSSVNLMNEARVRLQQKGAKQLVLYSASANAQGQALFRALGYRPTMVEMTMDLTAPGAAAAR